MFTLKITRSQSVSLKTYVVEEVLRLFFLNLRMDSSAMLNVEKGRTRENSDSEMLELLNAGVDENSPKSEGNNVVRLGVRKKVSCRKCRKAHEGRCEVKYIKCIVTFSSNKFFSLNCFPACIKRVISKIQSTNRRCC